jgi:hypothetical protein
MPPSRAGIPPKRKASSRSKRAAKPNDWLEYLRPIADELPVVVELLTRLRCARDLKERGLTQVPGPAGSYKDREPTIEPLPPGLMQLENPAEIHSRLLSPEEMARRLSIEDLRALVTAWEAEIREWGEAIWGRRKETLRLRKERSDLMKMVAFVRSFAPNVGQMEAARLVADVQSTPGQHRRSRSGAGMVRLLGLSDVFGNDLPGELSPDEIEELAGPPPDERALRRLVNREHKRGRGGVYDVDERLLRPAGRPAGPKR